LKFQCLIIIGLILIIIAIIIVNVIVIAATTIGETDLFEPYPLLEDSARLVLN
jgi:hypothetical protein